MDFEIVKNKLMTFGLTGTVIAVLCCFTPLLPLVLTTLGFGGLIGILYTDTVLLPVLAGFLILTGVALWRKMTKP